MIPKKNTYFIFRYVYVKFVLVKTFYLNSEQIRNNTLLRFQCIKTDFANLKFSLTLEKNTSVSLGNCEENANEICRKT